MLSHCMRLLWVLGAVVAQDLFEKEKAFLSHHDLTRQTVNPNKTSLTAQLAVASSSSWYKTITTRTYDYLCIDLPGGKIANGQPLWLWECGEEDKHNNQIWVFDNSEIRFGSDERFCIDASDMSDGTQMMLWECNGYAQQQWGWDSKEHKIFIINTGICLDSYHHDTDNGQALHVWDCNGLKNQEWSLSDSDRPYMKVFPSDHCEYETGDWPRFEDEHELQKDAYWSAYFLNIYGGVPSRGYPICTGAFQFLWQASVANTAVVLQAPTDCAGGATGSGQELNHGTYFTGGSFLEAQNIFGHIYNPIFFHASVPANHWVEVSHTAFPGDQGAIWFYMSVGSGVWLNVGTTNQYRDHPDMVKDILGQACWDSAIDTFGSHPTECEGNFDSLYPAAIAKGLNSIQLTHHYDCTCGPKGDSSYKYFRLCPTEIIALDDPAGAALGCSGLLRGGWQASTGCSCDETFKGATKDPGDGKWDCQFGCSYSNCGAF